jgi:hypothetical protein
MVSNASKEHAASIFRKEKSFEEYTSTLKSTPLPEDGGTVFLKCSSTLEMEKARSHETSVNTHQTTRYHTSYTVIFIYED